MEYYVVSFPTPNRGTRSYLSRSGTPVESVGMAMQFPGELFATLAIFRFLPERLHNVAEVLSVESVGAEVISANFAN